MMVTSGLYGSRYQGSRTNLGGLLLYYFLLFYYFYFYFYYYILFLFLFLLSLSLIVVVSISTISSVHPEHGRHCLFAMGLKDWRDDDAIVFSALSHAVT